jgi:hypothetical protein
MNRQLLEKPFDKSQIRQREGIHGHTLDFVPGHSVIKRLNDAFEANWSFEILRHENLEDKDEVLVLGKLTADNVVKTQFGSSRITRDDGGQIVSIASDLKAAGTDALKKCATLLGVGLYLYGSGNGTQQGAKSPNDHHGQQNQGRQTDRGTSNRNGGNGNGRLTAKQHKFILRLTSEKGMTRNELNDKCLNTYGVALHYMSNRDASALITELLAA